MFNFPVTSLRRTIFFRSVFTYLLVIIPIIILGLYLYNWSYNNASKDISRATVTQLNYYLEDLEREIEWMELQQFDLVEDGELSKLAVTWGKMSNVERRESLNYLLHRLTSFKNSSAFIKDINVHIYSISKTISAMNSVIELDEQAYTQLIANVSKNRDRLYYSDDAVHLIASKYGGGKGDLPNYVVQIELDSEKLRESLQLLSAYEDSGSFLTSSSSGYTVMSNDESKIIVNNYLKEDKENRDFLTLLAVNQEKYHIDKAYSNKLKLILVTYLPEETVKRPLSFFYYWAWLFAIASLIAIVVFSYSTYRFIHKPLLLLVQSFRRMEAGELDRPIVHDKKDEFGYLYTRFNHMLTKLKNLIDQDYIQKMMMQKSELKQLQSQINPHFLYNSFFILNSLAKVGDTERIEQFTIMLGEYFRFITRNGEDLVLLSEEIKHSRMYTDIQELRFSRRIRVQFNDLPMEMETIKVPRLIVQPIIENAYEHSLEKMSEQGLLKISFENDKDTIHIIVQDNGSLLSDEQLFMLQHRIQNNSEENEVTGIINIHRRLILTYGKGSGLIVERSELNGLKVIICIRINDDMQLK
ncbi:sensor histidine kinase [Paenibacillus endoradicis]|uniref:sensor histidine kinase n=1 Tax=Paenibacillus endoradicis TaxID=2972487 RepID=UPI002158C653|nr:histidine kinase [Paenibacillus endoradicis]MCR8655918.1 histidine kinase [Paenibacillus endoradicis]MCR8658244.1 histidine kinase [Paenibacillus endoradicis]